MDISWTPTSMGDICMFRAGTAFPKRFQGEMHGEIPFIKVSDLKHRANSLYIRHSANWVDMITVEHLKASLLYPGTIVFAKIGEGLKAERFRLVARPTCIDNNLMGAIPQGVDAHFLYYLMVHTGVAHLVEGSALPYLRQSDLERIPVCVPPNDEQRRIAGVLGALDDKIESNQTVVTRAEQLIDEIAKQKATDLPTVALSEVCSLSKSTWKPDASSDQTVHLFSLPAFDGGAVPEQVPVSSIKSNKTLMDRPGILVSRLNPRISRMWWVETDATPVSVCSPEFAYLTAGDMHGLTCTWLAVRSPEFRGEIVDRVTGTSGSHQRVRPADLMTIGVPDYRSLAEHTQMTVLTLLHLLSARRQQSVALAELRDALLPELMSGRMRVDEAGCLVSEALDEEVADV